MSLHVCTAAIVFVVIALAPASAGAHPRDCAITGAWSPEPVAVWFADGPAAGCMSATAVRSYDTPDAPQASARVAVRKPKRGRFQQVGHEPLMNRGMNAAIAVHGDYAYIGSRTDGGHRASRRAASWSSTSRAVRAAGGGGAVRREARRVDARAARLAVAGRPDRAQHELRRRADRCTTARSPVDQQHPLLRHLGQRRRSRPQLLTEFKVDTHEFFLWEDPKNRDRALIFAGNATSTCATRGGAPSCPFSVWDISGVPERRRAGHALQRHLSVHALPAGAAPGAEADRRPALADDQQRRQPGVLRAADRRLRDRRHVRVRGRRRVPAAAADHGQRVPAGVAGARARTAR